MKAEVCSLVKLQALAITGTDEFGNVIGYGSAGIWRYLVRRSYIRK